MKLEQNQAMVLRDDFINRVSIQFLTVTFFLFCFLMTM